MNHSRFVGAVVLAVALSACGGGSGGGDNTTSNQNVQTQSNTEPTSPQNGIYYNSDRFAVALVDKDAANNGLFVIDYPKESLFHGKTITVGSNTIETSGIYFNAGRLTIRSGGNPTKATFTAQGLEYDVGSLASFDASSYTGLKKAGASIAMNELVGTFTGGTSGGDQIQIDSAGNITLTLSNGCTFDNAVISRTKDYYYSATSVTGTGCPITSDNGNNFTLKLFTVKHQSADYIFAVAYNATLSGWTVIKK
ncbi:hypothetical protein [Vibrio sonorensis]|uniref:hypothetical protein n=1 Tax=Vibrio sonorensis TaxID=1004316 RepID=UPI0008DB02E0|nr:hypothetical protein [Vibrio sonorensis]